ncbi:class I SAM-dependent methyltransferase [Halorussus salinus]|uniref:class I SAM-dependent methyltransferase n=1 Tax=Halorussus salinus TaxID=1364935 RepID=UPI001093021B|nr:class I SAM-dependent methyltransferase [Halorussus salinus]
MISDVAAKYDAVASEGHADRMEASYWPVVEQVVEEIAVDASTTVLDLGTGNGYAARYFASEGATVVGVDVSGEMVRVAREASDEEEAPGESEAADESATTGETETTDDGLLDFAVADMHDVPIADDSIDLAFSMDVLPYSRDLSTPLGEVARVLAPDGAFHCCVNYYAEAARFQREEARGGLGMTLHSADEYADAFAAAGFRGVSQDTVPNTAIEIPPEEAFPTDGWETSEDMRRTLREWGTLLTVGEL